MQGFYKTDCGKVRTRNEDAAGIFHNKHHQVLTIVADGMGGHQAGEIASELVVNTIKEQFQETKEFTSARDAEEWIESLISYVNEQVYQKAIFNADLSGMGTTAVLSLLTDEFVVIGHVGDSRCYLWDQEKGLTQVTSDHSLVNELVKSGQISASDAEEHPRKNVLTKAIGTDKHIEPDLKTIGWDKNNCIILCSDGLSNKVSEAEINDALMSMETVTDTIDQLVQLANDRGGEDNITLAIVCNKEGEAI